jgi:hypothetical protein
MTLRNAARLALVATILVAALRVWNLIFNVLNVARGLVPARVLFPSLIYAFAAFGVALFFYVFYRSIPRMHGQPPVLSGATVTR